METLLAYAQQGPSKGASIIDTLARTPLSKVLIFVVVCTVVRIFIAPVLFRTEPHKRETSYKLLKFLNETMDAIVYAGVVVFMVIRPFGIQAFQIPSPSMSPTLHGGEPGIPDDFIVANKAIYRYTHPQSGDIVVFRPPAYACGADQKDSDGQPKVDFIKRCIGTPGDVIEIRGGVLYRNGNAFHEPPNVGEIMNDWKLVHYEGDYLPWKDKYIPVTIGFGGQTNFGIGGLAKEYAIGELPSPHDTDAPWVENFKEDGELTKEERDRIAYLSQAPPAKIPPGHYLMMGDNRAHSFDGRAWGLIAENQVVGRAEFVWLPLNRWHSTR